MADTSLVFNLLAKDKASATLGKLGGKFDKLAAGIVAGGLAIGAGLAKIGSDFAEASNTIQVGTGATGKALEGLESDFKTALEGTPASMDTVSAALANLNTMTGATGKTLSGMTTQVVEASRLLGEDGVANAEAFGQAMQQWQIPAEKGTGKLDKLFKVTQDYGLGLTEVMGHLNTYGSVLQNAGFTMEETAVMFGQLNKAGLDVSRVMPGMNKAFRDWASEGKNVQAELGKTVDKIAGAKSSTEALALATEVFGAEGAQRMTTAIRSGALSLEDLQGALGGTAGLIGQTAEGTETWQEKLQKLKNKGLVAVEPAASAVFDMLGKGADILGSMSEWAQRNTGAVKALAIALGSMAATIVAVNVGLKVYRGIQMAIRAATIVWTAAQWLLNVALTANPVGVIIVAIGALIAIIVVIATKTTWFQDLWRVAWGAITAAAQAVWAFIKNTLWENGIKKYLTLIGNIVMWVRDRFVAGFNRAKEIAGTVVSFLGDLPGRLKRGFSKLFNIITSPFRSAFNFVAKAWNNTVGSLSWSIPSWVPGVGGNSISAPTLPTFHQGGIVGGEREDQLVVARPREGVFTPEQMEALGLMARGGDGAAVPDVEVRVFIGDRELTDIVDVQVSKRDRKSVRRVNAGTGRVV